MSKETYEFGEGLKLLIQENRINKEDIIKIKNKIYMVLNEKEDA